MYLNILIWNKWDIDFSLKLCFDSIINIVVNRPLFHINTTLWLGYHIVSFNVFIIITNIGQIWI